MKTRSRGSALLNALLLTGILLLIVLLVLSFAAANRRRAIRHARALDRESCAFTGLNYARTYFANNFGNWNTYLAAPAQYNPIPPGTADPSSSTLKAARPELFLDLDADTRPDVYVFVRDNQDELPPATQNFALDNDQNVIVGALCISTTLQPRREDGTIDTDSQMVESLLSFNQTGSTYRSQAGAGASGTGNLNAN